MAAAAGLGERGDRLPPLPRLLAQARNALGVNQLGRDRARALGESQAQNAAEPLVDALLDGASDIRSEAAEALGPLEHPDRRLAIALPVQRRRRRGRQERAMIRARTARGAG